MYRSESDIDWQLTLAVLQPMLLQATESVKVVKTASCYSSTRPLSVPKYIVSGNKAYIITMGIL